MRGLMNHPAATRAPNRRRAYFESRFGQLHCRTAFPSTGGFDELTPLVALHDAPGTGAELALLLPLLGRDRSVYLPDLPGCGQSDGPLATVTVGEYGAGISDMLRGLRLREVDVLGVGVGAAIAIEVALQMGHGVRRLVLARPLLSAPGQSAAPAARADGSHLLEEWQGSLVLAASPDLELHTRELGARLSAGASSHWPRMALANWPVASRAATLTAAVLVLESATPSPPTKTLLPMARIESFPSAGIFSPASLERNVRSLTEFLDR